MQQSSRTELARGTINRNDLLSVELIAPSDSPPAVLVRWPQAPSVLVASPKAIADAAAAVLRVMAQAQARLATVKR